MEKNNIVEKDALTGDKFLAGHEYDNIRELDNRLPLWWLWLFIITIVFAVVYVFIYDVIKVAPSQQDEYKNEMAAAGPSKPGTDATASMTVLTDESSLTEGKDIWIKSCKACHLDLGQGQVGPNLCDTFAIHGCSYPEVVKIITDGAPEKGMIAWKTQLSPDQITKVASYIMTLKGTNPPNPKPPQGEPCK